MSTDSPTNPPHHNPLTYDCPTCSQSHSDVYELKEHYQNEHDPDWTRAYPTRCHQCGQIHARDKRAYTRAERHFCSSDCSKTWHQHTDDISRTTERTIDGIEATCDHCGDTFYRPKTELERFEHNFCSNTCQGKHLSGQNHHRWTDGQSFDNAIRQLLHHKNWERLSRERREQHPVCELCGEEKPLGELHSHHIIPILAGGTHDEDLLMTVCNQCHNKVENYTEEHADVEKVCLPEELRDTRFASANIKHARGIDYTPADD